MDHGRSFTRVVGGPGGRLTQVVGGPGGRLTQVVGGPALRAEGLRGEQVAGGQVPPEQLVLYHLVVGGCHRLLCVPPAAGRPRRPVGQTHRGRVTSGQGQGAAGSDKPLNIMSRDSVRLFDTMNFRFNNYRVSGNYLPSISAASLINKKRPSHGLFTDVSSSLSYTFPRPFRHPADQDAQCLAADARPHQVPDECVLRDRWFHLLSSSFMIPRRFPIGDRSRLLPGHTPFSQKAERRLWLHC